jgi:ribonuclease HI
MNLYTLPFLGAHGHEQIKSKVGIKVPSFHRDSWSMDLIDSNLLKEEEKGMVLCGCWSIWNERNKRRHGEGQRTIQASVQWVMQTTIDLAHVGKQKSKKPLTKKARWKPPDQGWVKINTDACYHQVAQAGSTGLVVRDSQGGLIRAQALWYDHAASAHAMEAHAIRDGARLAAERGYTNIIIESDAKEVVRLCDEADDRSEIMAICQDIREIKRAFNSCSISFVLNKLALIGGDACGLIITQVFSVTLYRVIVILSSK